MILLKRFPVRRKAEAIERKTVLPFYQ